MIDSRAKAPISKFRVITVESCRQGDELRAHVLPRHDTAAITWGGEKGGAASKSWAGPRDT